MDTNLILVVGITGVGKSTLCRTYSKGDESSIHFSASSFAKMIDGIDPDQTGLTKAIRQKADSCSKSIALVDGHLIIKGNRIPGKAISLLIPKGIILVTDNPAEIVKRRKYDEGRIRPLEEENAIEKSQLEEVTYAKEISKKLSVPLVILENASPELFKKAVQKINSGKSMSNK